MHPAKKRKIADESNVQDDPPLDNTAVRKSQDLQHIDKEVEFDSRGKSQLDSSSVDKNQERRERFKALQARAVSLLRPTNTE